MSVTIVPDAETLAVLKMKALESVPVPVDQAFNGIPFDYHHAAWWFEEMGISDSKVAVRHMKELRAVGATVALSTLDVMERSVCVRKYSDVEASSGEKKG